MHIVREANAITSALAPNPIIVSFSLLIIGKSQAEHHLEKLIFLSSRHLAAKGWHQERLLGCVWRCVACAYAKGIDKHGNNNMRFIFKLFGRHINLSALISNDINRPWRRILSAGPGSSVGLSALHRQNENGENRVGMRHSRQLCWPVERRGGRREAEIMSSRKWWQAAPGYCTRPMA